MALSNIILYDEPTTRTQLLPFTYTRPLCDIRVGITTIREKWQYLSGQEHVSALTPAYLSAKFPADVAPDNLLVNGAIIPDQAFLDAIETLEDRQALYKGKTFLAARVKGDIVALNSYEKLTAVIDTAQYEGEQLMIQRPWDIFSLNGQVLTNDYDQLVGNSAPAEAGPYNIFINPERIYIAPGAKVQGAILNASTGPIYIGPDAEVMEGCTVRGPFALCDHATLKMGGKVYGATTIGPHSKISGEVNNSVIFGYSNKGHDGFLGNSVLGEWCNLGADTNNSNLKNNYGPVKVWSYGTETFEDTGLQFCGLFMADHSKCGINTMFNTGTVVGVFANVFGADFPPKHVPSFAWGGADGFTTYHLNKAFEVAESVMQRRNLELTKEDRAILTQVFETTLAYRK